MITSVLKNKMKNFNFSSKSVFKKKLKLKKVITISVVILGLVIIYFIFQGQEAKAEWFNDSWMYRQRVDITNSGSAQTDFQVQITLDTATLISAGKMQSDCDDIRITNISGKILPYFQTTACNATKTRYWVKVDSIPTPSVTIYIYYGNPSVPAGSNRNETFDLSYLGAFSQIFSDANITPNHGASSDRENNFYISNSTFVNRFNTSWVYQQQYSALDIYTGLCYDDKLDRFYGIDWTNRQWSAFTTSFVETSPLDQAIGDQPIDCATDSTYVYTNHRTGLICRNRISDNNKECIDMDALSGFDWGGQGLTYAFGYLFAGTSGSYGDNGNRIYMIDIDDWSSPVIITSWDASGHTLTEVAGLTWKDKYIYQTSRSEDNANEWQGPLKVAATEPSIGSPTNEEQSPGPVAYWKFDEGADDTCSGGSNDTCDSTQNGNDGAKTGTTWQSEDMCVSGKCLYFDGSDDYVDIPSITIDKDNGTISLWFYSSGDFSLNYGTRGHIIGTNSQTYRYLAILGDGTSPYNLTGETNTNEEYFVSVSTIIPVGAWNNVAVSFDSGTVTTYLNGTKISTRTVTDNVTLTRIGGGTGTTLFEGKIDEVKIYPYARSAAEIKADYLSGSAGTGGSAASVSFGAKPQKWLSDGLVGYWKMDEFTGASTTDSSGNGHTGTITGAAWTAGKYGSSLDFEGVDYVTISSPDLGLSNEVTLSIWQYGDVAIQPQADAIFEGVDASNNRIINVHLPWSNSNVYWDAGNSGTASYDRINKLASDNDFEGQWNHWLFTKNANTGEMKIYLNGQLWHSGTGNTRTLSTIATLRFGSYGAGTSNYDGMIDEIRVYKRELSAKEVRDLYNWAPGPVGYWKMDEASWNGTSGEVKDSSTYGNNGTRSGNATTYSPGKFGTAGTFDGTNDYTTITDSDTYTMSDLTIAAWVKTSDDVGEIVSHFTTGSPWVGFVMNVGENGGASSGKLCLWTSGGGGNGWDCADQTVNDNAWHHIAVTFQSSGATGTAIYYIDGTEATSTTKYTPGDGANPVKFGENNDGGRDYSGLIDDVRIYNYARTPRQIVEDMNAGHPVGGSPVGSQVSYWKFDEGYGDTANDSGFGGNNGNLAGACPGVATCPTWTNSGKFGKALSFDGGDYVEMSSDSSFPSGTADRTITSWVKVNSFDNGRIFSYGAWTQDNAFDLIARSGDEFMIVGHTNNYVTTKSDFSTSVWYHIAAVLENGDLTFYYNGIKDSTQSTSINTTLAGAFRMGNGVTGRTTNYYDGKIDEVKIYNFALTEDEIKLDYNRGASVVLGAVSTDSSGNPDWSSEREYCIPGDVTFCSAPVAEWKFDEKTGSYAYDTTSNDNKGQLGGGTPDYEPIWKGAGNCKHGACLLFDGVDDYVDCGTGLSFTGALTIETWVKLNDLGDGGIVGKYSNWGYYNYALWYESNQIYFEVGNKGTDGTPEGGAWETKVSSNTIDTPGQWYHVVGSYDENKVKLFVNAIEKNSANENRNLSTGAKVCVGSVRYDCVTSHSYNETNSRFDGFIDGMRIYDYALTQAQIAWSYNRGGPVGWWKFDECQATTTYDSSGNGNNGAITIGGTGSQDGVGTCADVDSTKAWYNGRNGKYNYSLNFDGADDYIDISDLDLGNDHALSVWIKGVNYSSTQQAIFKEGAYYLSVTGNNVRCGFWGISAQTGNISLTNNNWYLLTQTYDGSALKCYVNGVLDVNYSTSVSVGQSSYNLEIGRRNQNGTTPIEHFNGQIDEAKTFNYALTAEQVKTDYNQGAAIRFGPSEGSP